MTHPGTPNVLFCDGTFLSVVQISGYPLSSCSPDSSMSTPSSSLPSFLLASNDDKSSVGSDKGYDSDKGSVSSDKGSSSSKGSIFDAGSGQDSGSVPTRDSGSVPGSVPRALPVYNRQSEGSCIIRVSMDGLHASVYKSILVSATALGLAQVSVGGTPSPSWLIKPGCKGKMAHGAMQNVWSLVGTRCLKTALGKFLVWKLKFVFYQKVPGEAL